MWGGESVWTEEEMGGGRESLGLGGIGIAGEETVNEDQESRDGRSAEAKCRGRIDEEEG